MYPLLSLMTNSRSWWLFCGLILIALSAFVSAAPETGLLFYLSGEQGTTADFSAGKTPTPNFDMEVTSIADGAKGKALSCADLQRLSYWAPGNIYAQRGTLSFFWRSRYPVGPTEFPIFRVAYADHSSWDMVWLRIDYNGHGFDAFVTDVNLARVRVSVEIKPFPKPNEWTHIAISWDETQGICFYVNGKLAATKESKAVLNTGLDQFGPHSRIISPHNVQSDYNFVRGGDIDELRIYDRMLSAENVATLAKGDAVRGLAMLPARDIADARWRDEWALRYGWNRPGDLPIYIDGSAICIRKVEILEAYDMKRWWWKACDGIRETTWPGVYNRSRLPGRSDYFHLPDWDCYVESGKSVTFIMPDEPWNHLEISGVAWGTMSLLKGDDANDAPARALLFERPEGQERTYHHFASGFTGQKIRFTNVEQEEPIGELSAYNVTVGKEPDGSTKLAYRLGSVASVVKSLEPLQTFISGRYEADERATLVAQPVSTAKSPIEKNVGTLPIVHVLIPNESTDRAYNLDGIQDGLDGIAIDLPALNCRPGEGGLIPLNIQVKDPLWPMRDMLDFTFSVKPGEAKTLWLDLRDRILPPGKALYLTIASGCGDFGPQSLANAELRLVFKPRAAAQVEHEIDRFIQARDSYAMLVEEHPRSPKFNLWNRFEADITDLMRVNPNHYPGREYYADGVTGKMPVYRHLAAPDGVPLWAFRQVELLGRVKNFVNWWIDNRQVPYGDFGGGISDDVDLVNMWPGMAFMGCDPEKLLKSDHALLEAAFKNGMFTNGLPTIQTDELHSYEEGINCLGQNLILDFGNPLQIERAMATARGVESITGINAAGHRHIRTSYYSGTRLAEEAPWNRSKYYSYLVLQPELLLVDYNGNPSAKKVVLELADSLLAHRFKTEEGRYGVPSAIQFDTDKDDEATRGTLPWPMYWGAYEWTGDSKYLTPFNDGGIRYFTEINANTLDLLGKRSEWAPRIASMDPDGNNERRERRGGAHEGRGSPRSTARAASMVNHFKWQITGDKKYLEQLYTAQIEECQVVEYIGTEGHLWIDRVGMPYTELQRARLGGIALVRGGTYSGHAVSWKFHAPANEQSLAVLIPDATATSFKVIAFNLDKVPVRATLTGWHIDPGVWEITQGLDTNGDDVADQMIGTRTALFERSKSVDLTFPPRTTTVLTFKLKTPGTPYWKRSDIGISREDVVIEGRTVQVKVHSLGSVDSPATTLVLRDAAGRVKGTAPIPPIAAPVDLQPKSVEVRVMLPEGFSLNGGSIELDPENKLEEITTLNNRIDL